MFMPKKRRPNPSTARQNARVRRRRAAIVPATPTTTAGSAMSVRLNETS